MSGEGGEGRWVQSLIGGTAAVAELYWRGHSKSIQVYDIFPHATDGRLWCRRVIFGEDDLRGAVCELWAGTG